MDSMYFDSVEKLLPAEFAKGYKILLFYEKGRKLSLIHISEPTRRS